MEVFNSCESVRAPVYIEGNDVSTKRGVLPFFPKSGLSRIKFDFLRKTGFQLSKG